MKRNHGRPLSVVRILLFIALWIGVLTLLRRRYVFTAPDESILRIGIENPGTQIELVEPVSDVQPNPRVISVRTTTTRFDLRSLVQLRGLVHINDAATALRFVRLRTSRDYCYSWRTRSTPQEIVSFHQCALPEFNDTGSAKTRWESGTYGVLSDAAYRIGRFEPPKVTPARGAYRIVRWVCIYSPPEGIAVEQWEERVTTEGGYHRTVLRRLPPPKLPDTRWYIYGLH